uniref:Uncharacterized protein n=1 Tax=Timema shepardi TaxID=629360 RepID=A0A7R9BA91_TIMSH|nr:unnamed protein product [Timema shepardi]
MEKLFDYTVPKCLVFPPDESDDEENDAIFECASTVDDVENVENARYQLVDVGNSPDLRELCKWNRVLEQLRVNQNVGALECDSWSTL